MIGPPACETTDEKKDKAAGFESLDEWALFAPFVITFVATSLGLLVYYLAGYHQEDLGQEGMSAEDILLGAEIRSASCAELRKRALSLPTSRMRPTTPRGERTGMPIATPSFDPAPR